MKLSSRKELLKESELTLKSIKKSLNEAAVPQREVEKVKHWMEDAIQLVIDDRLLKKYDGDVEDFFRYLEIQKGASPVEAKKFAKNANESISPLRFVIANMKGLIRDVKKLEAKLPEIEGIMKAVESDLKKMK
jgi:hypothetical protein